MFIVNIVPLMLRQELSLLHASTQTTALPMLLSTTSPLPLSPDNYELQVTRQQMDNAIAHVHHYMSRERLECGSHCFTVDYEA